MKPRWITVGLFFDYQTNIPIVKVACPFIFQQIFSFIVAVKYIELKGFYYEIYSFIIFDINFFSGF